MNGQVLDIIFAIGRVEHLWCIVWILFLCDTHVDSNVRIAKRVKLERDIKFLTLHNFLFYQTNSVSTQFKIRSFKAAAQLRMCGMDLLTALIVSLLSATLM